MRLARLQGDLITNADALAAFVERGRLDLLQLDYPRPHNVAVHNRHAAEFPEFAETLAETLRSLAKALLLEPQFRVVASAGWSNAYACVESVAQTLVEQGCRSTPIAAVRGSNLLPILDFLQSQGVDLHNVNDRQPWTSLHAPILAADLQLGAGPLQTALTEGARVIVAGCFDHAAPAIAAAVEAFQWSWQDAARIAGAALAARAAAWHVRAADEVLPLLQFDPLNTAPVVELEPTGEFTVDLHRLVRGDDAAALLHWLHGDGPRGGALAIHADVRCQVDLLKVVESGPRQLRVAGAAAVPGDDKWRLDVLYQAAFVVETIVEVDCSAGAQFLDDIVSALLMTVVDPDDERSRTTVTPLRTTEAASSVAWLHVCCRSPQWQDCQQLAELLATLAVAHRLHNRFPAGIRLPAGLPVVAVECNHWQARIPRDAVDIAVDSRPASEWL